MQHQTPSSMQSPEVAKTSYFPRHSILFCPNSKWDTRVSEAPASLFSNFVRIHSSPLIQGGLQQHPFPVDTYSVDIKWYRVYIYIFHVCICVCVCVCNICAHVYEGLYTHPWAEASGGHGCTSLSLCFIPLKKALTMNLNYAGCQKSPERPLSLQGSAVLGLWFHMTTCFFFMWFWGFELSSSCLHSNHASLLCCFSAPHLHLVYLSMFSCTL